VKCSDPSDVTDSARGSRTLVEIIQTEVSYKQPDKTLVHAVQTEILHSLHFPDLTVMFLLSVQWSF